MTEAGKISLCTCDSNAQMAWHALGSATSMLDIFDWAEVREQLGRAHSLGHILDPTAYQRMLHNPNIEVNAKLAAATETFLKTLHTIKTEADHAKQAAAIAAML